MKIMTSELSGVALDWAVAQVVGQELIVMTEIRNAHFIREKRLITPGYDSAYCPSTEWGDGGPLIDRFDITIMRIDGFSQVGPLYQVMQSFSGLHLGGDRMMPVAPTRLIAACRAIVAAKLGDEVDVLEGLA